MTQQNPYGGDYLPPPYQQPQPQPGYYQQPPPLQPPRRKRHRLRTTFLVIVGVIVVIIIAVNASKGSGGSPAAGTTPSTPAASTAPKATTAPAAAVKPHVLIHFAGSGIRNSAPFNVGSGALTVHYTFNCASFGQSGNFVADLEWGNQASLNSDDQTIANALAMRGSQTTTVYPADPGKDYYLSVNSECTWRVKVST